MIRETLVTIMVTPCLYTLRLCDLDVQTNKQRHRRTQIYYRWHCCNYFAMGTS